MLEKKDDYDVIVIGSGIGGGACAALLSSEGFKTLVLEKNRMIGGMSSSYQKEGFTLDSAIHVFSSGIKGRFGKILKKAGVDTLKFVPITTKTALKALGQKGYTKLSFNPSSLGSKSAPNLQDADQVDLSKMGFRGNDMPVMMKIMLDILGKRKRQIIKMHEKKLTFEQYLDGFSPSKGVKSLFAFLAGGMFGLAPRDASAPELIIGLKEWVLTNDLSYPIGGAVAVPRAFLDGVKKHGGEIRTNTKVSKIIVENDRAIGVEVDGESIYSRIVVSNAGIKPTVFSLVGRKYFNDDYIQKVDGLRSSYSAITFKFALKEPIIDDIVFLNLYHGDLSVFGEKEKTPKGPKATGFMVMIPTNADPSLAPPGHQIVIFGTLAPTRPKNWKEWIDYYYQQILRFYPNIEDKTIFMDITTPQNLAKMSGKAFGPIETTALTPDQSGPYRISSELPINDLYVVGDTAGTNTHGIGTQLAADSAIKLAKIIIKKYKN
ncbi:MAG: NAD(P)-binding protein [Candidatus Lokiarchaeota archaeon]|nr:NAD(P)-binding protein [Candidatus Lokiarchaeota archaeon]